MNAWVFVAVQIVFAGLQMTSKSEVNSTIFLTGNLLCLAMASSIFVENIING